MAATNRDLKAAIDSGGFRRDLYYRLNVVSLSIPQLRDRRDDIPLLAAWFLRRHSDKAKRQVAGFSPEALACLMAYEWPGNVRELENAVEQAVVLGQDLLILSDDLPDAVAEAAVVRNGHRRVDTLPHRDPAGQERPHRARQCRKLAVTTAPRRDCSDCTRTICTG